MFLIHKIKYNKIKEKKSTHAVNGSYDYLKLTRITAIKGEDPAHCSSSTASEISTSLSLR